MDEARAHWERALSLPTVREQYVARLKEKLAATAERPPK